MIVKVGPYILPTRTRVEIVKSLDSLCDMVQIDSTLSLSWWLEKAEYLISVEIGDTPVFEGRVEVIVDNTETGSVRVLSRDLTADLVDCPYTEGTGEFKQLTPLIIMSKVASAFNVSIAGSLNGSALPSFGYLLNEPCSAILSRLSQSVGWVVTSDGKHSLLHWSVATSPIVERIVKGQNGDIALRYDNTCLFSSFIVLGQGTFERGQFDLRSSLPGSSARVRPFVLISEGCSDLSVLTKENKRVKDYMEGARVSAHVKYYGNKLLLPGQQIELNTEGISEVQMIKKVTFSRKETDTVTLETFKAGRFGGVE